MGVSSRQLIPPPCSPWHARQKFHRSCCQSRRESAWVICKKSKHRKQGKPTPLSSSWWSSLLATSSIEPACEESPRSPTTPGVMVFAKTLSRCSCCKASLPCQSQSGMFKQQGEESLPGFRLSGRPLQGRLPVEAEAKSPISSRSFQLEGGGK